MADLIKKAARARMAVTGEPYTVARRAVIEEHKARIAAEAETAPEPPAESDSAKERSERWMT